MSRDRKVNATAGRWFLLLAQMACGLLLCGCVQGRISPERPTEDAGSRADPAERQAPDPTTGEPNETWWRIFDDDELNQLVEEALASNHTLAAAWRRLEQSGFALRAAQAARYPGLQLSGVTGQSRSLREGAMGTEDVWGVSAAVSYELDVWQRLAATIARSGYLRDADAYEARVLAISVAAAVCDAWFDLHERLLAVRLLENQLSVAERSLEVVERRYHGGLGQLLDVYQQRELVASVAALLPQAEAAVSSSHYRLAVLLGARPDSMVLPEKAGLAEPALFPPLDARMDWVLQRPDVRAAHARLRASEQERVRAARTRLPSVRLVAQAATRESEPDALFDRISGEGWVQISLPVLDGGLLRAETGRAAAVWSERESTYLELLLQAERELEEAIALERAQAETVIRMETEIEAARRTLALSEDRYRNGLVEYLNVLTAQQRVQQLERGLLRARRQRLAYQVQVARATAGHGIHQNGEE